MRFFRRQFRRDHVANPVSPKFTHGPLGLPPGKIGDQRGLALGGYALQFRYHPAMLFPASRGYKTVIAFKLIQVDLIFHENQGIKNLSRGGVVQFRLQFGIHCPRKSGTEKNEYQNHNREISHKFLRFRTVSLLFLRFEYTILLIDNNAYFHSGKMK